MFSSLQAVTDFLFSIVRITSPILFAALGAVIAEKAGVCNIGLEGTMMIAALFGSLVSYWTGSWVVGVLAALIVGVLIALMMGFFAFKLKTDVILSGIAVNMIGAGGTIFLCKIITDRASTDALITQSLCIPAINIPLIQDIPILSGILSGHSVLTYVAFLLVFLMWLLLYKTPLGLNIRAVGENPNAAESVGVSVLKIKYAAIGLSGLMAGFGGAFMSMYYAQGWSQNMVAGRGFIALAAQAMGNGEPLGAMLSSLLFGFAQAFGIKMSAFGLDSNLVSAIPYAVTILGLVIYAIGARNKLRRHRAALARMNGEHAGQ